YDVRPFYATGAKALVGSATLSYRQHIAEKSLYIVNYSLQGTTFHYADNLSYSTITPAVYFGFRPSDFRSNEKRFVSFRNVNVFRDKTPEIDTDPDYSVFNARYNYIDNNILSYRSWFADVQVAEHFSKLAVTAEYRKLFRNNRQLNLRLFAGKFIHNTTGSDFFSFALDRPTDYLFDYNYLGRSEDSGLYSQQIIIAEGGFKSKLGNAFANDWMLTGNASINLWRWIELYGDAGLVRNSGADPQFVYDSGIRLNLVTDYFELYLPLYSNNGWEISQPAYNRKIRFIITLSPRTLTGLFTRKWF
ncbi:MAG: metalloprotease, partial [Sinomicrobium sp.]|nr:metalloprotease [Sinomicrobium sp.]